MKRLELELADVFRRFGTEFVARNNATLSWQQRRVIEAIEQCRTAALGGHKEQCNACGHASFSYNSCRNRHCPKCQAGARAKWMSERASELLPGVSYFHLVFTLPQTMAGLALQNKAVMYDILFRATAETLKEVAANPEHLGAKIGFFAVLHSWGQQMQHHPHLHCVIPAGGLSPDGQSWVPCKRNSDGEEFFLPVGVLRSVFRGKFIDFLRQAYQQHELLLQGRFAALQKPGDFERFLDVSVRSKWRVFAKRPFADAERVLKYLARYTHRVAISNSRLIGMEGDEVVFRWKNYRQNGEMQTARLQGTEFMRRFLQHVLPKGFTRIRHFGILSNRLRSAVIDLCRELLDGAADDRTDESPREVDELHDETPKTCPVCEVGQMFVIDSWEPGERELPETSVHRGIHIALHGW